MTPALRFSTLLARVIEPSTAARVRMWMDAEPWRFMDWSVDTIGELRPLVDQLKKRGLASSRARTFDREQADHSSVEWDLSFPIDLDVPFLKSPYRGLRTITHAMRHHTNGAYGLDEITIGSTDPESTVARFSRFLGPGSRECLATFTLGRVKVRVLRADGTGVLGVRLRAKVETQREIEVCGHPVGIVLIPESHIKGA